MRTPDQRQEEEYQVALALLSTRRSRLGRWLVGLLFRAER